MRPHAPPPNDAGIVPVSPLELAAGWPFGRCDLGVVPRRSGTAADAVQVLEDVITEARGDRNCFVAFSGGRDSSAVLALATRAARRHGLPDPVPVTERFPGLQDPEDDWQELTVRHLGLKEWIRKDGDSNSDLLGPASREFLRRYGVVWPATISANLGLAAVARGGVLLTGEGGDGVWATYRVRAARRLLKRRPSRAAGSAKERRPSRLGHCAAAWPARTSTSPGCVLKLGAGLRRRSPTRTRGNLPYLQGDVARRQHGPPLSGGTT